MQWVKVNIFTQWIQFSVTHVGGLWWECCQSKVTESKTTTLKQAQLTDCTHLSNSKWDEIFNSNKTDSQHPNGKWALPSGHWPLANCKSRQNLKESQSVNRHWAWAYVLFCKHIYKGVHITISNIIYENDDDDDDDDNYYEFSLQLHKFEVYFCGDNHFSANGNR